MGLLSKVASGVGKIRDKGATALSGVYRNVSASSLGKRVASSAILKGSAKFGLGAAKFAGKALVGTKLRAALTVGTLGVIAVKKLKGRKAQQDVAIAQASNITNPQSSGLRGKILKGAAAIAGLGAAAFVGEQIAEKLGVRGGAGFIGKRKSNGKGTRKRRRTSGRRGRRCRRRRGIVRGRGLGSREIRHSGKGTRTKLVSFTTKQGKRVRFRVKR